MQEIAKEITERELLDKLVFDYAVGGRLDELEPKDLLSEEDMSLVVVHTIGIITTNRNRSSITLYVIGYRTENIIITLKDDNVEKYKELVGLVENKTPLTAGYVRGLFLSINKKSKINNFITDTNINIKEDGVYYKGIKQSGKLIDHILKAIKNKKRVKYLVNFLEKLMENPSYHIHTRLYDFLEHSDIEILEDGDFLAYKNLRSDFTDIHSGSFDNSLGNVIKMDRNLVDDNDRNTCSSGLHVAAKHYLPMFSSYNGVTVSVKVNPKNVVSIPVDYSNSKMRTCEYQVLDLVKE